MPDPRTLEEPQHRVDPQALVQPRREITGSSAMLLPFTKAGDVDWGSYHRRLEATFEAGLIPAVNMDTGYVNLIDEATRERVLSETQKRAGGQDFVAGAFVSDEPGAEFDFKAYQRQIEQVEAHGGIPVIFQSYGLTEQLPEAIVDSYRQIGEQASKFIAFELGTMFANFGKIYDLGTYAGLMEIDNCLGAKHSSLNRRLEWQRLALRDEKRPGFKVFTGNDLAIDMVRYGSDYLLGVSAFAPEAFARRDVCWAEGDEAGFYEWNDLLQYLGFFAFRVPVPAYKHSAAQFLALRGQIASDVPHLDAQRRPFARLRDALEALQQRFPEVPLDTLSMGMSADLEAAVLEGATLVRLGTAIFGERDTR
jgi:dihydrodipicolinate synthase/N-acetylneuraminate lyase